MVSLIVGTLDGLGRLVGLAGDATPYVPSAPVEIGTSKPHHAVAEAGSWQALIVMFGLALVVGAAVLMFAVRQRARLVERRRVRRMAAAVALMGDVEPTAADAAPPAPAPPPTATRPHPAAPRRTQAGAHRTRHAKSHSPERVT